MHKLIISIQTLLSLVLIVVLLGFSSCATKWKVLPHTYSQDKGVNNDNVVFDRLVREAQRSGKPIFLDFYTKWCRPCKKMDETVFKRPDVSLMLNNYFLSYKVDAEDFDGIGLAQRFKVFGYPTFVYLSPDGEEIDRINGFAKASQLINKSKSVLKQMDEY